MINIVFVFFYLGGDTHGAGDVDAEQQQGSISATRGLSIRMEQKQAILVTS